MKIRIATITFLIMAFCQNLFAYPIDPIPLRQLILRSENIVLAQVLNIEELEGERNWNTSKATLLISEELQGKAESNTIYVYFSEAVSCPAPPDYQEGKTVLAFLNKMVKKENAYYTPALSYGTKYLSDKEIQVYCQRISEMNNIQKIENELQKNKLTIDWLIKCASQPETKMEGMYELSSESRFMSEYDKEKDVYTLKQKLTDQQTIQLRKLFFSTPKSEYLEFGFLDLIKKENDKELNDFLIERFEELEEDTYWWIILDFMEKISYCTNRNDLKIIYTELNFLEYTDDREEKEKKLIAAFRAKL